MMAQTKSPVIPPRMERRVMQLGAFCTPCWVFLITSKEAAACRLRTWIIPWATLQTAQQKRIRSAISEGSDLRRWNRRAFMHNVLSSSITFFISCWSSSLLHKPYSSPSHLRLLMKSWGYCFQLNGVAPIIDEVYDICMLKQPTACMFDCFTDYSLETGWSTRRLWSSWAGLFFFLLLHVNVLQQHRKYWTDPLKSYFEEKSFKSFI